MIDLVAGYARGYDAEQIRPFLKSLRQSGYEGKILLFANGGAAKEAIKWDVEIRQAVKPKIKVHSARFLCLEEELREYSCEGIFLSDTRDVIFQKNPSSFLPSEGLHVFEEDASISLASCPYNSLWIELGYGKEILKQIGSYPISCVGTTCGDKTSILSYLKRLREEIEKIQPRTTHPQDQAAHNFLIRGNIEAQVWHNEEGEIYTVGYIDRGTVKFKNNKIINQSGLVPTVVHQWDRHRNLKNLVKVII